MLEHIFWINLFCTLYMTGLIWMVQLVHYPSFAILSSDNWPKYHDHHTNSIDKIVIPVMSLELATSGALLWFSDSFFSLESIGFYIVVSIWISTGLFSVPTHYKMTDSNSQELVNRLVHTNWIRTILWSSKAVIGYISIS